MIGHLEALAADLIAAGLCAEIRPWGGAALVKAWHPLFPVTGLSVGVDIGPGPSGAGTLLWFRSVNHEYIAPCSDPDAAVSMISDVLGVCAAGSVEWSAAS